MIRHSSRQRVGLEARLLAQLAPGAVLERLADRRRRPRGSPSCSSSSVYRCCPTRRMPPVVAHRDHAHGERPEVDDAVDAGAAVRAVHLVVEDLDPRVLVGRASRVAAAATGPTADRAVARASVMQQTVPRARRYGRHWRATVPRTRAIATSRRVGRGRVGSAMARQRHASIPQAVGRRRAGGGRRPRSSLVVRRASFVVYDGVGTAPGRVLRRGRRATRPTPTRSARGFDQAIADANLMPVPAGRAVRVARPADPGREARRLVDPRRRPPTRPRSSSSTASSRAGARRTSSSRRACSTARASRVFLMDLRDHGDSEGDDAPVRRRQRGVPRRPGRLGLGPGAGRARRSGSASLGVSFGSINAVIAGGQEPAVARRLGGLRRRRGWTRRSATSSSTSSTTRPGSSRILVPGAMLWARVIAGDDLTKFNPIDEVDALRRPVDRLRARRAATRCSRRRWRRSCTTAAVAAGATTPDAWIVPAPATPRPCSTRPGEYEQRLVDFFTAALGAP